MRGSSDDDSGARLMLKAVVECLWRGSSNVDGGAHMMMTERLVGC